MILHFVSLDTCCQNIEVVYSSDTPTTDTMRPERFGRYTLSSETVNGRGFYESDSNLMAMVYGGLVQMVAGELVLFHTKVKFMD